MGKQTVLAPHSTSKVAKPKKKKTQNVSGSIQANGYDKRMSAKSKTRQPAVRAKRPAANTPNGNAGRTSYSYK